MKVFVFGASGFIGLPVCQAFIRKGYEVFGQTRSAGKVRSLEENEITAVVADPAKVEEWLPTVEKSDVVIDCIGGSDIQALSQKIFDATCEGAQNSRSAFAPKLTYIYCSGVWVHGDDRTGSTSERAPPKNTTRLVTWRPAFEAQVRRGSAHVDGIVLRPALVYGRAGSILAMLFGAASAAASTSVSASVSATDDSTGGAGGGATDDITSGGDAKNVFTWPGTPGGRWALVHVDDVADAFVRAAERGAVCAGLVFDVANDATEAVDDVLAAVVRVSGAAGYRYRAPANLFEEAITTTTLLRPSLLRSLAGWRPYKASLVDGMRQYHAAWKAAVAVAGAA